MGAHGTRVRRKFYQNDSRKGISRLMADNKSFEALPFNRVPRVGRNQGTARSAESFCFSEITQRYVRFDARDYATRTSRLRRLVVSGHWPVKVEGTHWNSVGAGLVERARLHRYREPRSRDPDGIGGVGARLRGEKPSASPQLFIEPRHVILSRSSGRRICICFFPQPQDKCRSFGQTAASG